MEFLRPWQLTILKDGGVVFGAALDFEDGHAHPHHVADERAFKSSYTRLQGSKYVQSLRLELLIRTD